MSKSSAFNAETESSLVITVGSGFIVGRKIAGLEVVSSTAFLASSFISLNGTAMSASLVMSRLKKGPSGTSFFLSGRA